MRHIQFEWLRRAWLVIKSSLRIFCFVWSFIFSSIPNWIRYFARIYLRRAATNGKIRERSYRRRWPHQRCEQLISKKSPTKCTTVIFQLKPMFPIITRASDRMVEFISAKIDGTSSGKGKGLTIDMKDVSKEFSWAKWPLKWITSISVD